MTYPYPTFTPIRDSKSGQAVRIGGRAHLTGTPLQAPLTGRPCAAWEVMVEEFWPSHGRWMPIVRDARAIDFLVRDPTGTAFVSVRGGTMSLIPDTRFSTGWNGFPPVVAEFVQRHGQTLYGPMGIRSLRCLEGVLLGQARVAVIGSADWEPDPDGTAAHDSAGYRDAPQRLVLRASLGAPLSVSHDPTVP